jgi:hypothetical protein
LADSLRQPAKRAIDTLNNNEQVSIDDPLPGRYQVRIKGKQVPSGVLPFAVSYRWDSANSFLWDFPLQDDPVVSGSFTVIRWTSCFPAGERGLLQWRFKTDSSWVTISDTVMLGDQHYKIKIPDTLSPAAFRMVTGGGYLNQKNF